MEEQFILRVLPSVAERIERLLNEEESSSEDKSLDLSFSEDGRTGEFVIGNDCFTACLMNLPTVAESYKAYDDTNLIKTADVGVHLFSLYELSKIYRPWACDHQIPTVVF